MASSRPNRPARPAFLSRPSVNIRRSYNADPLDLTRSVTSPSLTTHHLPTSSPILDLERPSTAEDAPTSPTRPTAPHHNLSTVEEQETPQIELSTVPTLDDDPTTALTPSRTAPGVGVRTQDFEPSARPGRGFRAKSRNLLTLGRTNRDSAATSETGEESRAGRSRAGSRVSQAQADHDDNLVHLLDVIDPEVSTLSTLTNLQNSLFIPDLGPLINRRATYNLSRTPTAQQSKTALDATQSPGEQLQEEVDSRAEQAALKRRSRTGSITSTLSQSRYAVLPHGFSLQGWSEAEKEELNDHVRHLLHSRRAAFKRGMKGFGKYVRKPLGFFVTLYATLITLFGLAWVLFLIGWINVGGRQSYLINVIDNVLVALFAVVGDGLAPFRAVDTYHMIYIAHYTRKTWRLRKEKHLPKLPDHNDLPLPNSEDPSLVAVDRKDTMKKVNDIDLEAGDDAIQKSDSTLSSPDMVLTAKEQKKLEHHQAKFAKSHTFYKPHETETHHAFPVKLLIAIVVLLDMHSCLQIALGTCTWAISYHVRPFALTTVILCCSLTCNITGGILISIGDHRTRKKEVKERMFRQQLTEDAMQKMEKRRQREIERNQELEKHVDPNAEGSAVVVVADDEDEAGKKVERKEKKLRKSMDGNARKSMDGRKSLSLSRRNSSETPRKSMSGRNSTEMSRL